MKKNKTLIIAIVISLIVISITILFSLKADKLELEIRDWVRPTENGIEKLRLHEDNKFSYETQDEDLKNYDTCTKYKYKENTNTIKLTCKEKVKDKEIKIVKSSNEELILQIGKKEYTFVPAEK